MNASFTLHDSDLQCIESGGTVTVANPAGPTFEITSEAAWTASTDPAVRRFALSARQLDHLRWKRAVVVLPVGFDGVVDLVPAGSGEVAR